GFVGADVHPPPAVRIGHVPANAELGKCRLHEANDPVDVVHAQVGMFQTRSHRSTPLKVVMSIPLILEVAAAESSVRGPWSVLRCGCHAGGLRRGPVRSRLAGDGRAAPLITDHWPPTPEN